MAQDLKDFYLNHDDLVIGGDQLDQMAVGDLYGALKKKHEASKSAKALGVVSRVAAGALLVWGAAGPIVDCAEHDPTKKQGNHGFNKGNIAMFALSAATACLSMVAFSRYKKNDAAARNLNDAYLMKQKPKNRADANNESLYPDAIDGLIARGHIRKIEKFEYNN